VAAVPGDVSPTPIIKKKGAHKNKNYNTTIPIFIGLNKITQVSNIKTTTKIQNLKYLTITINLYILHITENVDAARRR
jgi:hypothetical protein